MQWFQHILRNWCRSKPRFNGQTNESFCTVLLHIYWMVWCISEELPFVSCCLSHLWTFPVTQGLGTNTGLCYGSYVTPMSHGMSLVSSDNLPSNPVLVPGSPPIAVQSSSSSSSSSSSPSQKLQRADKLEVFRHHKEWFNGGKIH